MARLSLEVPDHLLEKFDKHIKGRYNNRSEGIRAAMRILIDQIKQEAKQ